MVKKRKELTMDDLGAMVQRGFAEVGDRFVTLEKKADERFGAILERFQNVESDLRDIKGTMGFLVSVATEHERKFGKIESRLRRLEYKVGLAKLE